MSAVGYINVCLEMWSGVLLLIIVFCQFLINCEKNQVNICFIGLLTVNAVILISDASAWLFKGHMSVVCYFGVRISNFLVFILGYILLSLFTSYLTTYLEQRTSVSRLPLKLIFIMSIFAMAFVIISQFNHMFYIIDENNVYHRQKWFWISQIWGVAGMCINAGLMIRYRKALSRREQIAMSTYIVLPITSMLIQIFVYGVALLHLSVAASLVIIFLTIQVEQAKELREKDRELAESRVAVMLSQIQPHFLFNALTAIKQLCDTDPQQAKEAISEFAVYLRGNLDSLTIKNMIPFERELEQVNNYLALEQKRFGSRVNVVFDIQSSDFEVPPLTVQTVVENAVRHGITKKPGGGTVTISARERENMYLISVVDDGVGIRTLSPDDGKSHVGVENAKSRLEIMCGGSMDIKSELGRGTEVTIKIPKGGFIYEDDSRRR